MTQDSPLSNVSIVVTRPSRQNQLICTKLASLGAKPIAFPCIDIAPKSPQLSLSQTLDMVIFISPNAVEYGLEIYRKLDSAVTKNCKVAAIGTATAQALSNQGIRAVLTPKEGADSESFLKLPELGALPLKTVLIIKGVGGRTLLKDKLSQRGIDVLTIDAYERIMPDSTNIQALPEKIDLILFTSNEIVQNFLALIPECLQKSLLNCQTVVGHPRIAEKVTSLGFKNLPIIATSPADGDMLSAIMQWADKNGEK